jgi:hypothetical protein
VEVGWPTSILPLMHGQLTDRSVADVCRELADAGATGVLHVAGIDVAGRLVFDQGRLVAASSPTPGSRLGDRLVNGGLLEEEALHRVLEEQSGTPQHDRSRLGQLLVDRGLVPVDAVRLVIQEQLLDAVFDITGWRHGTFRFEHDAEPDAPEVPLAVPVDQALVEVTRRREEWAELSEVIPDLDAVPRFREGASSSSANLEPDEFAILASVDGQRSVRDLAYDLGYGEFEAARIVYALTLLGLLEVELPTDEIGAALDDALAYVSGQAPERDEAVGADEAASGDVAVSEAGTAGEPSATVPGAEVEEPAPWESWNPAPDPASEPTAPTAAEAATAADATPADDAEPADLEADLPDLSMFDDFDGDVAPEQPTSGPDDLGAEDETTDAAASQLEASAADPGPQSDDAGFFATTPAPPPPAPAEESDGDVSEFLRELSRLALDDEPEESGSPASSGGAAPEPPPRPRSAPEQREEPKKKKRGLFGFGG